MKNSTQFNRPLLFAILIIVGISSQYLIAQTDIPGGDVCGKWSLAYSPYYINGEINIPNDSTLTIEPGVEVIFTGHYKFNVQGSILALGIAEDSIKFTVQDHEAGWHGIRFIDTPASNDSSIFEFCVFEYGKANTGVGINPRSGGALLIRCDKVRVSHCLFQYNLCYHINRDEAAGGAIAIVGSPLIEYCEFRNNQGSYGSTFLIYYSGANPLIRNNYIHHNNGHGTVNIGGGASPFLVNNIIADNQTDNHGHVHFANTGGKAVLINNTIANNSCSGSGGGIFINHGLTPVFINTIIHGNEPSQVLFETSSGLDFYHCLIEGGTAAFTGQAFTGTYQNNIDADPLFVDATGGDFHLTDNSPCISTGVDSIEIAGTWYYAPSSDYEKNPKPFPAETAHDIGACESLQGHEYIPLNSEEFAYMISNESACIRNYPNPLTTSTTFSYKMNEPGMVSITIFDITGKKLDTIIRGNQGAGEHEIVWIPKNLSDGIYFYQFKTGEDLITNKLLLTKSNF